MTVIQTMRDLKRLASRKNGLEAFIVLNYGLRSSKHIWLRKGKWTVFNSIDDTTEENMSDTDLEKNTNVVRAMKLNSLVMG